MRNVPPPAICNGDIQNQSRIVGGFFLCLGNSLAQAVFQLLASTYETQAHIITMQLAHFSSQGFEKQSHETAYLFLWAPPILATERKQRQKLDASFRRYLDRGTNRLDPGPVTGVARLALGTRPATVPV